jgi:hypothetical protein
VPADSAGQCRRRHDLPAAGAGDGAYPMPVRDPNPARCAGTGRGAVIMVPMAIAPTRRPTERDLRRLAARRGLVLRKCRKHDPAAPGYGRYRVLDARTGAVLAGAGANGVPGLELADVERYLRAAPLPGNPWRARHPGRRRPPSR